MKNSLLFTLIFLLCGCSGNTSKLPKSDHHFDLFDYFQGQVIAKGMVQDRQGKMIRRFTVDIKGEITGNKLTLTEGFVFDDGKRQQRIWHIEQLDKHSYRGTADDVVGHATGIVRGDTLNWRYVLSMDVDGSNYHITFDDWMFLLDNKRLLNKAQMTKWGIEVGQVTLFFEKVEIKAVDSQVN
jgi:hypothetical protein